MFNRKEWMKKYWQIYYLNNKNKLNADKREYSKRPKVFLAKKRALIIYREKNKEKVSAHRKLEYLLRKKEIIKPLYCEKCNEIKLLHAHHEDYNKPYSVIWLCVMCHKKIHIKN